MTIATILYAWTVTFLLGAIAAGVESLLRNAGRQARWVWALAILASVALGLRPLFTSGGPVGPDGAEPPTVTLGPSFQPGVDGADADALRRDLGSLGPSVGGAPEAPGWPLLSTPVPYATGVWVGLSSLLLLLSLATLLRLRARMKSWRGDRVAGVPVLLSRDFGPAAVGLLRGRVVLPEWAVDAVRPEQLRMAVVHELEHVRGRDLPLLALFGLLVVAMPWNVPLWWQARRMTRSVELDCDRRVVRGGHDPRAYGELLISMSSRGAPSSPLVPALGRRPLLRTRIEQLARRDPGRAAKTLAAVTVVAAVVGACTLPTPTAPVAGPDESEAGSTGGALPVIDASIVEPGGLRALTTELGRKVADARGVVALAVRADVESGLVRHVRVDRATGPSVSTGAVQATVAEVAARLHVRAKQGQHSGGWIPLWILFMGSTVEAHLVKHELYQEKGWPDDPAGLARHMDVFYRLRAGGLGALKLSGVGNLVTGRPRDLDPSYAMAAADRPEIEGRVSDGSTVSDPTPRASRTRLQPYPGISVRRDERQAGEGR